MLPFPKHADIPPEHCTLPFLLPVTASPGWQRWGTRGGPGESSTRAQTLTSHRAGCGAWFHHKLVRESQASPYSRVLGFSCINWRQELLNLTEFRCILLKQHKVKHLVLMKSYVLYFIIIIGSFPSPTSTISPSPLLLPFPQHLLLKR